MAVSVQEQQVVEVLHLLGDKFRKMAILGAHRACLAIQFRVNGSQPCVNLTRLSPRSSPVDGQGGQYDPEALDLDDVNQELRDIDQIDWWWEDL